MAGAHRLAFYCRGSPEHFAWAYCGPVSVKALKALRRALPLQRIFATPRWSSLRRCNASRHIATRSSPARPESWRVRFSMGPPTIFLWRLTVTGRSSWLIAAQQWPARNRSTRWEHWACGGPGCQVPLHLPLSLTWSRDRSALLIRLSRPMGRPLGTRWRGPISALFGGRASCA